MRHLSADYLLHFADNALILGHRNSEWTGHGPILEQDIAISNIALDLVGQARNFYQYAADVLNNEQPSSLHTEDTLAYLRDAHEFRNFQIVELPKGDWSFTVLRQFLFSTWQKLIFEGLITGNDTRLAAIAGKSIKETSYHIRWSGEWVIRLGDGTPESRRRLIHSLDNLWPYTNEFLNTGITGPQWDNSIELKDRWLAVVRRAFVEATLKEEFAMVLSRQIPNFCSGGNSHHSPYLATLLKEMQILQRTYPGCEW